MWMSPSGSPALHAALPEGAVLSSHLTIATLSKGIPKVSPMLNVGGVRGDGETVRGGGPSFTAMRGLHAPPVAWTFLRYRKLCPAH
jgi:hypothetical protein